MATGKVTAILVATFLPIVTHAQLAVTEVMYDLSGGDTGREWIEVQNIGADALTLTEWKLFEANSNHGLTTDGSDALAPGQFAIIADDVTKFRADWPSYTGLIMNSSFSLSNTGETLALRCCGKDLADRDGVSYSSDMGAAGDGNSLHRNGNGWSVGAPSPGSGAILAPLSPPPEAAPQAGGNDATEADEASPKARSGGAIAVDAGGSRTVLSKSGIPLSGKALTSKKEPIEHADFSWNFGDGRTGSGKSITHAWGYPGRYQVTLRVSYQGESATDSFVVDVIEPDFSVIRYEDGSIGIRNDGTREADISRWRVQEDGKNFVVPDGTVILKNALLRLSPETLGFIASRAALHYPDGVLYARADTESTVSGVTSHIVVPMPAPITREPELTQRATARTKKASAPQEETIAESKAIEERESETEQATSSQLASAAATDPETAWYWWAGAACISLLGAAGMYFVRRGRDDAWEIIDSDTIE